MINKKLSSKVAIKVLSKSKKPKTTKLATIVSFILISTVAINLLHVFEPSANSTNNSYSISKFNN